MSYICINVRIRFPDEINSRAEVGASVVGPLVHTAPVNVPPSGWQPFDKGNEPETPAPEQSLA
jgi:hypothetical protein